MKWISVRDGLPDDGCQVLAWVPAEFDDEPYYELVFFWKDGPTWDMCHSPHSTLNVSHWLLPDGPDGPISPLNAHD